jgi:hypothetical protein
VVETPAPTAGVVCFAALSMTYKKEPLKATLWFPKAETIILKKFLWVNRLRWECSYIGRNFTLIWWDVKAWGMFQKTEAGLGSEKKR